MSLPRPNACLWIAAALTLGLARSVHAGDLPVIFASDPADLAAGKAKYLAGDKLAKKVVGDVLKAADKSLENKEFYTVVNKPFTPPSGDKHDYMSLSPYWWPDPSKADGKPYIRRDGEFNPEREKYDLGPMEKMANEVEALGMAYYFTGEEKYAERAAKQIRVFFLDPATKMNPNLMYGQHVPGLDIIRASGIIEGGRLKKVVDAVGLIQGSKGWTAEDQKGITGWFKDLTTYLTTSKQGKEELEAQNNHGTWAVAQVATYYLFAGDEKSARELLDTQFKARLDKQIKPDGSQPEEMARTISFHYHRFNLLAFMDLATLGDRVGLDLWNYKTADGRSLRTALDYLLPVALGEKKWPKEDIREPKWGDMIVISRRAANKYNEPKYEAAAQKLHEKDRRETVDFLYPAKMK